MIVKHRGKMVQVTTCNSTGAIVIAIDGVRLRGPSFIWERDAVEFARKHIDATEQESAQ